MAQVTLTNCPWEGELEVPSSKSVAHRMLICAALAGMPLTEVGLCGGLSEDLRATWRCLEALRLSLAPELDCGESASTLRFLLPVTAAMGRTAHFRGGPRLSERPIRPLLEVLARHGASLSENSLPLELSGKLDGGEFLLPGDVSSQFVSGVLLALPLTGGGGAVRLSSPLESEGYVRLTQMVMAKFGVRVMAGQGGYSVEPCDGYHRPVASETLSVEGDWSAAAFPMVAATLGGRGLLLKNLPAESLQGDCRIVDVLRQFGARVSRTADGWRVEAGVLRALPEIDVRDIPDAVPALAVLAGVAEGTTRFVHATRLRLKESDRLASACAMLRALGGKADMSSDSLTVTGVERYAGGVVDGCHDHRIVMAAAAAAVAASGAVSISDAEAVSKSWPSFWEARYQSTGEREKS